MKAKSLHIIAVLVILAAIACGGTAWALDEAVLTPTDGSNRSVKSLSSANMKTADDKAFGDAMKVWFFHRYSDGEKLLKAFAKEHPDSPWRAEAQLHQGCYQTYTEQYDSAKQLFKNLATEYADTNIKTKAYLRLGNIAEHEANTDEAIGYFASVLNMNPTWDQFKYANYHARKLMMTRNSREARVNCGPVALAACLNALGKTDEADIAKTMKPTEDGLSLAVLEAQAKVYGVPAQCVEMPFESLKNTTLPVLAHIAPNHFIAILGINDGKIDVDDSIQGKHQETFESLEHKWSGKVLVFTQNVAFIPLTLVESLETTGGCCGQIDEDECTGDSCSCQQTSSGPGGPDGCAGCDSSGGGNVSVASAGRPTYQVNVDNLNVLVKDTPIFYDPGKGPTIAFTLTYSNENSNTGIFGRGWRCQYDMKVFFLPSSYDNYPTLQVHRDDGRIETYLWNGTAYSPRAATAYYGYRDTIAKQSDGTVVLSLRGGGKYYFMAEGTTSEGRIHIIEDAVGNQVTCGYDTSTGCLESVTDANGAVTEITPTGTGIDERVTEVTLPSSDGRSATFEYADGNLTSITDMLGDESTLSYNAMLFYKDNYSPTTNTSYAITTTVRLQHNLDSLGLS